jgi:hypothetical protein
MEAPPLLREFLAAGKSATAVAAEAARWSMVRDAHDAVVGAPTMALATVG